ncbi:MAG TPA: TetR family transcriptional regulator [Solirubrobacteraceae bacterium]|nr:TetR family transcriptional regulator [Solirubrobacteraceae bacterium]
MSFPLVQRRAASAGRGRRRDAEASRRAILDAAEQLFSQLGYDRASLGEIGRRAGVSAALPAYFYGGKEGLYGAVLERLLAEREDRLEPLASRAAEELERGGGLRPALELLIDGYIDFLRERPALVRLMGREALDGGRRLAPGPRHSIAVAGGLARFVAASANAPAIDVEQLLITTVALCFFPIEHNDTMLAAMGLDAASEAFACARKRHVVDVLEQVLSGAGG